MRSVLSQGDFTLKGNAVNKVATLFAWYDAIEKKIEASIKIASDFPEIKKMGSAETKPVKEDKEDVNSSK